MYCGGQIIPASDAWGIKRPPLVKLGRERKRKGTHPPDTNYRNRHDYFLKVSKKLRVVCSKWLFTIACHSLVLLLLRPTYVASAGPRDIEFGSVVPQTWTVPLWVLLDIQESDGLGLLFPWESL
jgi:hypothetical protein